ncbi:MAG TPA: cupin domain-containing protein [Tepidisphaeraceae bacterium]|jgi:mannose-6-phosphate isomerase-like protein (cupin superfamily)|nr:cupin domain-containing protein [Tepidisphaeraceae bacterium]
MKHIHTSTARGKMFVPLFNSKTMQAAMMTLRPGQISGELGNEHPKAEQWLFVIAGSGAALGKKSRVVIRTGSLLFIRKGEVHQIKNTGRQKLVTLNLYAPPAYTPEGEVRRAVKSL